MMLPKKLVNYNLDLKRMKGLCTAFSHYEQMYTINYHNTTSCKSSTSEQFVLQINGRQCKYWHYIQFQSLRKFSSAKFFF